MGDTSLLPFDYKKNIPLIFPIEDPKEHTLIKLKDGEGGKVRLRGGEGSNIDYGGIQIL